MDLALFIYLADVVDRLSTTASVIAVLTGMGTVFLSILYMLARPDPRDIETAKGFFSGLKVCGSVFAVSLALALFAPSKNTMYLMAGGYAAQELVASDTGAKVITIINQELDKMIGVTE